MPSKYKRGEVTAAQHAMDLVRYAEQQRNGLRRLWEVIRDIDILVR